MGKEKKKKLNLIQARVRFFRLRQKKKRKIPPTNTKPTAKRGKEGNSRERTPGKKKKHQ